MRKKAIITILFSFISMILVLGQTINDTILLEEIQIRSGRISTPIKQILRPIENISTATLKYSTDNDISSALQHAGSVDIRQRGFNAVQSDLNIRGGNFDQNIVLLNGINLSNPQTGHHNLNLPVSTSDLSNIEVFYGAGTRNFGPNAFTGAVNFITQIPDDHFIKADISAGSFKTINNNISAGFAGERSTHYLSANYSQSDGFTHNTDFHRKSIYYENNTEFNNIKSKLMLGYIDKAFGAYNFYSPRFPDQYEKIRSCFTALIIEGTNNLKWKYNLYWNNSSDRFELLREDEDFYTNENGLWINYNTGDTADWYLAHNHHLTNVAGTGFNTEFSWAAGKSAFGADYRYEHIFSNVLGKPMIQLHQGKYSRSDFRHNFSVFAEHVYSSDKIIINSGIMTYWNQHYNWNFYYGTDAGYYINNKLMIKAGINKAMRLPSFTELYYESLSNIGNPDLKPENSLTFETGIRFNTDQKMKSEANLLVFHTRGKNIIAWIREHSDEIWKTENLTNLNTTGFESSFAITPFSERYYVKRLKLSYMYLYQDKDAAGLESKYTLDHLKHRMNFSITHKIHNNISGFINIDLFKRNGRFDNFDTESMQFTGPVDYQSVFLLNYSLYVNLKNVDLYLKTYNITNTDYFDIGNVPTPGFSFLVGAIITIGL